ncbi:hypothetical protein [Anaeroselena agilis]|uniref:Uncharacterized protein n=1 Tax=Anaeroselena agilis TaxID=3063788 RepID=A0ABU3NXD4_9FIRM|nr:hypothetical protein [Selenomonadales bacterium 4137-cl]
MDYGEIREAYLSLPDNDLYGAYILKTQAVTLQETFESELAQIRHMANDFKVDVDFTQARRSKELAPDKVNEGERLSKQDEQVLQAKRNYNQALLAVELKEAQVRFLEKVYFDCRALLARGEKKIHSDRSE